MTRQQSVTMAAISKVRSRIVGIEPAGQRLLVPAEAAALEAQREQPAERQHEQQASAAAGPAASAQTARAQREHRLPAGLGDRLRGGCGRDGHRRHCTSISRASAAWKPAAIGSPAR